MQNEDAEYGGVPAINDLVPLSMVQIFAKCFVSGFMSMMAGAGFSAEVSEQMGLGPAPVTAPIRGMSAAAAAAASSTNLPLASPHSSVSHAMPHSPVTTSHPTGVVTLASAHSAYSAAADAGMSNKSLSRSVMANSSNPYTINITDHSANRSRTAAGSAAGPASPAASIPPSDARPPLAPRK